MSSTVLPRLAAISEGLFILVSASIVARTRLIGLREPSALASTFCTPATSNTARIAPPAITPVPSEAGRMQTLAAPCWPQISFCQVRPLTETEPMFLRDVYIPLEMAYIGDG